MAAQVRSEKRGKFSLVSSPINMEGLSRAIRSPTPEAGQHTEEILSSVGYSAEDIRKLRTNGVI